MAMEKKSAVAIVMGSDSDMEVMKSCIEQLKDFGIEPIVRILSAHRSRSWPQILRIRRRKTG